MKVPSYFFANRTSNFVLKNLSTYEIAPPCPNIILGAVYDDGNYAGDDADYNYDGDAIVITIKIMNVE